MIDGLGCKVYERIAANGTTGGLIRPGGLELTDRALSLCAFPPGSRLLDVGCGTGATVKHLIERHGFLAAGIDSSLPMLMLGQKCLPLIRAEAENLPFRDGEWDGVLAECTLSVTGAPDIAFRECARVLRRGGKLILSDVYLKNSKAVPEARALQAVCQFARAPAQEELMSRLEKAGCQVLAWEDHSAALKHFAAQLILSGEAGPPSLRVPTGPQPSDDTEIEQAASFAWLGYFLAVAMKSLNG